MTRPRPLLLCWFLFALALFAAVPARSAVLISELCDPQNNYATDRFLEIYNAGPDAVDLAGWRLVAVANSVDAFTWNLSGVIQPGQARVCGNTTTITTFTVDFPGAWSAANGNWNGKVGDGARLVNAGGQVVDLVVATGTLFENADLVRKASVTTPTPVFDPTQWTSQAVLLATNASPGTHAVAPPPPGPIVTNLVTLPASPLAADTVQVHADVTDTTAAITSVTLAWGNSAGSQPYTIPMTLVAGATYATTAAIPVQAEGTSVYYEVQATNAASATTTSAVASYALPYALTLHQIQGEAVASPYVGSAVVTRGTVTASLGNAFVLQDGSGPWSALWVRSTASPAPGDSVEVRGTVSETDALGLSACTVIAGGAVTATWPGGTIPPATPLTTAAAATEPWEGVLAVLPAATCTNAALGAGRWQASDSTGALPVDGLGFVFVPTLGTTYAVTGPIGCFDGAARIVPRNAGDITWVADHVGAAIVALAETGDSTFTVTFSEPVDAVSAAVPAHYVIAGHAATSAARDGANPAQVLLTVPGVPAAWDTLVVNGVADLFGNATAAASWVFPYIDMRIPAGYYDSAIGLRGTALRAALHEIIKNHTVVSYNGAWDAYRTTDRRPDGKVWDVYSDIPGGTAPYEYDFSQVGGVGGREGTGYTREHTWCKNWFGGAVSPMYSDLWIIYPCDTHVNGTRGVNPYGDVAVATWTSLNGSRIGASADSGYTGTVFEPINAFKGDLARSYFYVSTRYYTEDAAWPGGPAFDRADLLPWARQAYLRWSANDPVSLKERLRNGAVYALQHNRNPFIDHPEFIALLFDSSSTAAVDEHVTAAFTLRPPAPNPFHDATTIRFELPRRATVDLRVYDASGRVVRTLLPGVVHEPGSGAVRWDGRDDDGRPAAPGLYFSRLRTDGRSAVQRLVLVR